MVPVFDHPEFDDHELLVFGHDAVSELEAIIAIHSTKLGPAWGGCRIYPYASSDEALTDVLRLSRGMTYKSALARLPFGGGKTVVLADPRKDKTRAMMLALGDIIEGLGGSYVTGEDSGTDENDIRAIGERTSHVRLGGQTHFDDDPSITTSRGVFIGIQTAVRHKLGADKLDGIRVAIQGCGMVGHDLARLLQRGGAEVTVADISASKLDRTVKELGVKCVAADRIISVAEDVFAPCAFGAVVNEDFIERVNSPIIAGAANNQLAHPWFAEALRARGILYAPDFAINAGGILHAYCEQAGSSVEELNARVAGIGELLTEIFDRADDEEMSTHDVAEAMALEYLGSGS